MESLAPFIPFLKVLAAFVIMLTAIRFKLPLWLGILTGGVALGVMFGLGVAAMTIASGKALADRQFHLLLAIVSLILALSDALERSGQSKRLMDALSGYLRSPRLRLVFFPALIGLLPMPGGAIFSAPMVKTVSEDMTVENKDRALINYWFRHVWETAWPLYPGIILTVALADITLLDLLALTWPGVVAMFVGGWFFYLRPIAAKLDSLPPAPAGEKNMRTVLMQGLPLLTAIVGAVGLESAMAAFTPGLPFELGVITALLAACIVVMVQNKLGLGFLKAILFKKSLWQMMAVITSIFIFKDVMQVAGVVQAMAEAAGGKAALLASAIFLPFIVGTVAGINVAFVGSTFPLIIGVINSLGMQDQLIPYLVLGTFAGFTGVMFSPIHICFLLTCQFFHVDVARTWRRLIGPCVVLMATGVGLFYLYI